MNKIILANILSFFYVIIIVPCIMMFLMITVVIGTYLLIYMPELESFREYSNIEIIARIYLLGGLSLIMIIWFKIGYKVIIVEEKKNE